ncbi:hypothetical protein ACFCY0_41645 [Streptomyces chartreusis]|uniref:hypothetical protein n=1 Tax=Streptomyces chartreusis TaxID=1969 RepID=UPI0035E2457E
MEWWIDAVGVDGAAVAGRLCCPGAGGVQRRRSAVRVLPVGIVAETARPPPPPR